MTGPHPNKRFSTITINEIKKIFKKMKKILTYFCYVFTVVVLLASFAYDRLGRVSTSMSEENFSTYEIRDNSGSKYIVVYNDAGIAICPKVKQAN